MVAVNSGACSALAVGVSGVCVEVSSEALRAGCGVDGLLAEANIIIAAAPVEIFSDPDFGASPVGAGEEAGVFSDDMFFP